MKPRQREQQKQSARMYLRKHDHRDVIYDDKYHNAIWANTEDIDDELVWVKYAKNAMISQSDTFGWFDIDRQFRYANNQMGNQSYSYEYYLEEPDITILIWGYYINSAKLYYTKDGVCWKDITPTGGLNVLGSWQILKFGENGICTVSNGTVSGGIYYVRKMIFEYDEESDEVIITTATNSYATTYSRIYFLCNTQTGIIVWEGSNTGGNNPVFYTVYSHIEADGTRTTTEQSMSNRSILGSSCRALAYCKNDNHCCAILWGERIHEQYTGRVEQCVEVMCTHDNGMTWHGQTISDVSQANSYYVGDAADLFYRNGYFYAIYSVHVFGSWKTHLYKSQYGITWDEVVLPTWVDLPLIQGGGTGVANPSPKETLRVAIDPLNTSNYDVSMNYLIPFNARNLGIHNLMGGDFAANNILYQDGEITENNSFWYMMYNSGTYGAYFDTEQLGDTSKAFAWKPTSYSGTGAVADPVIPYDYVLG